MAAWILFYLLMATNLSVASYNCQGLGANRMHYIKGIVDNHTFVLIQEHWLLDTQLHKFETEIPGVCSHSISGINDNELLSGRPYGGCSILWNNNFTGTVKPVAFKSKRLCGVVIETTDVRLCLCNVYMPTDTVNDQANLAEFNMILQEIINMSQVLDISNIVIGGDFNTDFTRTRSLHTASLSQFMQAESFSSWLYNYSDIVDFTFESKINFATSLIDHFILTQNLLSSVIDGGSIMCLTKWTLN